MSNRSKALLFGIAVAIFAMAGCSGGESGGTASGTAKTNDQPNSQSAPLESKGPITLTLFAKTLLLDEDFNKYIKEPLQKKYPNITINKVDSDKGHTIQDLLTAGQIPDFIWEGLTNISGLTALSLPMDLEPLAKKYAFDLNRLDPQLVKSIRSYSENQQLIYMPFRVFPFALHYNKDIFDKFGVPYPKDNMTWDDAIELARKVTGTRDGVNYRGLHSGISINRIQTQMSLPYVDPKTEKPVLTSNERWQTLFRTFKDIYSIPGNWPEGATLGDGRKAFLETRNLAMFPHLVLIGDADFAQAANNGLNWGITTFPTMKDKPGVGPGVFSDGFVIPEGSKNVDAAFQVITYLLSDEVQGEAAKLGNPTSLSNPEVQKKLYQNNPLAKGVNLSPILSLKFADPYTKTKYDGVVQSIAQKYLQQHFTDKMDLNTALRSAEEEMNKAIDQEKLKTK